jgi:steroid 5-alpha reductase family enzyme
MILILVISAPIIIINTEWWSDLMGVSPFFFIFSLLGTIIAPFWLIFETMADIQLSKFIKTKKPGEIFTTGLYRYSRHPNYFGESVFWLGIVMISLPYSYIGIISWITITVLLLFVSGVPLQEARYAGRPNWEEYKSRTSVFIPWFARK